MAWPERLWHRLFGTLPPPGEGPLHHGPLVRGATFRQRHARWLQGQERTALLAELREHVARERMLGDSPLHLLDGPQAAGLEFARADTAGEGCLHHLLEEFKDRTLSEGYRVHLADLRIDLRGRYLERYHLKPEPGPIPPGARIDQRYGNVLLECRGPDGRATHMKVLITKYDDRHYSAALPASMLLARLLEDN